MSEDVFQAAVRQRALRHAFQSEALQPRPDLFHRQVLSHGQHLHSLLAGGQRRNFGVETRGVYIAPLIFLSGIALRVRVRQQQRSFYSFFFFLFLYKGVWGEFSFSFLFFLFLRGGGVVRLLSVCCPHCGGGRIISLIFTECYGCPSVVRFLTKYTTQLHFFEQSKHRSSG